MRTKIIVALFTLLFSISAQAVTVDGLIKTYGKEAIMKAIAAKIDGKFTIDVDGTTQQAYAPSIEYITSSTLTDDIERAGMTVKLVEDVFLQEAAKAEAEEKVKVEDDRRRRVQLEKERQEAQKYREEDEKFLAEASESEKQEFRMARLRGVMNKRQNKGIEQVKIPPVTQQAASENNCDSILAKQKEIYANKYPNNFIMQKMLIEGQCESYLFLKSYTKVSGIPDSKIAELKQIYANKYPNNFIMQKMLIEGQVESFLELHK